jgi:hypothetical protein
MTAYKVTGRLHREVISPGKGKWGLIPAGDGVDELQLIATQERL